MTQILLHSVMYSKTKRKPTNIFEHFIPHKRLVNSYIFETAEGTVGRFYGISEILRIYSI